MSAESDIEEYINSIQALLSAKPEPRILVELKRAKVSGCVGGWSLVDRLEVPGDPQRKNRWRSVG